MSLEYLPPAEYAHSPSFSSTQHQQDLTQYRDCDQSVDGSLLVDHFCVNAEPAMYRFRCNAMDSPRTEPLTVLKYNSSTRHGERCECGSIHVSVAGATSSSA
jgi:hypothetical protein